MSNITLAWPNYIDRLTVSSADPYSSTLPLSNVLTPIYSQVARVNGTSTQIKLVATRHLSMGAFAIVNHNLSAGAKVRVRVFYESNFTTQLHDSGWMAAWRANYESTQLEWEDDTFWLGTPDAELIRNFNSLSTYFADQSYAGLSLIIDIEDSGNTAGYLEFGRLFVGQWWQPRLNPQYGNMPISYEDQSERAEAGDGTDYFYKRKKRRTVSIGFENLNEVEAISELFGLQLTQGIDGEILYTQDKSVEQFYFQRTFIGRLQQLDPLSQANYGLYSTQLNIREVI